MGIGADGPSMSVWVDIIVAASTIGGSLLVAGWRAKGMQAALDKKISDNAAEHEKDTLNLASKLRTETGERFEAARKERTAEIQAEGRLYGDTITALRARINEVDIQRTKDTNDLAFWVRDNMVSKPDHQNVVDSFNRGLDAVRADIKEVGVKIDRFIQGMKEDRDRSDHR